MLIKTSFSRNNKIISEAYKIYKLIECILFKTISYHLINKDIFFKDQ